MCIKQLNLKGNYAHLKKKSYILFLRFKKTRVANVVGFDAWRWKDVDDVTKSTRGNAGGSWAHVLFNKPRNTSVVSGVE